MSEFDSVRTYRGVSNLKYDLIPKLVALNIQPRTRGGNPGSIQETAFPFLVNTLIAMGLLAIAHIMASDKASRLDL